MIGIYRIKNKINNKSYIGQSTCIENRWKQHLSEAKDKSSSKPLYQAIRKYGVENFSFEVLEECDTSLLDEKEVYYINLYNSYKEGYNATLGGQGKGFQRKINPEIIYRLWDEGKTIKEIQDYCSKFIGHTAIYNYLSQYDNYSPQESHQRGAIKYLGNKKRNKKISNIIYQYNLWGNYINTYNSLAEAEKITGINADLIGRVINGRQKQAGGYQWLKENEPQDLTKTLRLHFGIIQYDLSGNEICRYKTLSQASQATGCCNSAIVKVCKHQRKTSGGYRWEYDYSIWNGIKI